MIGSLLGLRVLVDVDGGSDGLSLGFYDDTNTSLLLGSMLDGAGDGLSLGFDDATVAGLLMTAGKTLEERI